MPPRRLISATASSALFVAAGPQMPGAPENVMKLPMRSLLGAPRRSERPESNGDSDGAAPRPGRVLNSTDGGRLKRPAVTDPVESTPTPWLATMVGPTLWAGGHTPSKSARAWQISYSKMLNVQEDRKST